MVSFPHQALGIYISIPFCRSKCTYCNFASGVYPASEHARYVERIAADLRGARTWAAEKTVELPRIVDSIYLGGGTPSLLAPELIAQLFASICAEFDVAPEAEITVECAPAQLSDETLAAMVAAGVNRVSLGAQSFIDAEVKACGRLHDRSAVERDIERLRAAGIFNLNVDLIAGLAGQTRASWSESLSVLAGLAVPHASVYMLEIDEDSRLGRELLAGGSRYRAGLVPNDDVIADMYEEARAVLAAAGLEQYEISNFCRSGFASLHNLRYWQRRPYLGVGVDASSMLRACAADEPIAPVLRATTTDDLAAYLSGNTASEYSWLSADRQHEEAWFLGLRLNRGVEVAAITAEFGKERMLPARAAAFQLIEQGLLDGDKRAIRLTGPGRLLSNEVFARFLDLDRAEPEEATPTRPATRLPNSETDT